MGPKAAEVIRDSRIVINLVRDQNMPDGTNMRTFEVPGAGGFLLATRTVGACELFAEGLAGAYFASPRELLDVVRRYQNDDESRRRIAEAAAEIVRTEHRYVDRAQQIVEITCPNSPELGHERRQ